MNIVRAWYNRYISDPQVVILALLLIAGFVVMMTLGEMLAPVMAGVIGRNKFSYDVWGDTVNLAARLESRSTPGRILLCPNCRQRLEKEFEFETMGSIDIKGIGACETWYLTGRARAA